MRKLDILKLPALPERACEVKDQNVAVSALLSHMFGQIDAVRYESVLTCMTLLVIDEDGCKGVQSVYEQVHGLAVLKVLRSFKDTTEDPICFSDPCKWTEE